MLREGEWYILYIYMWRWLALGHLQASFFHCFEHIYLYRFYFYLCTFVDGMDHTMVTTTIFLLNIIHAMNVCCRARCEQTKKRIKRMTIIEELFFINVMGFDEQMIRVRGT